MDSLPQQIGSYTVLEVLGEGGMGTVYLAEQTEPLRRRVALKVLKSSVASRDTLAHFERERQALAVMDHPSIAKVFDAGITEDGNPYVVMERVDGTPIGEYCDDRRLTIRQRVALFGDVCRAIQHAHQKGVIHSDLKPGHVLVTDVDERPMPRIIDFGIATAMERAEGPEVSPGKVRRVVGTPGYMSPEQMEGSADIDTRADIYALGVILYELLVGVLPFEPTRRGGWAAVAAQLRDIPTPTQKLRSLDDTQDTLASRRRTTPSRLRRELHGDLEWIVSRAMATDRSRRYETAHQLGLDLERYLRFEPVGASPGGAAYRARKFARRNRVGVAFGSVVTLGLMIFTLTTTVQASRIAQARDDAEVRRAQAEGLIDFMLSELRVRLEAVGRLDILDAVGDRALAYFSLLPTERYSDEELSSRSQALYQIGQVRLEQGRLPEAGRAFEQSLRLARELSSRQPDSDEWLFGLGQAEFWAGERYRREGDLTQALAHFLAYRDVAGELARRDPDNPAHQLEVGYSHTNVGTILHARGDLNGALAEFSASLEAKERVAAGDPGDEDLRYDVGQGHNLIGAVLSDLARLDEAKAHFETDLAIKDSLVLEWPENATYRFRLAVAHRVLGWVLHSQGDIGGAEDHFRSQRSLLAPLIEGDPSNLRWVRAMALAETGVAHALLDLDEVGPARLSAESAVDRLSRLVEQNPDQPEWQTDLAAAYRENARALLADGRLDEARNRAEDALRVARQAAEAHEPERASGVDVAKGEVLLGEVLQARGEAGEARAHFERAADRLEPLAEASSSGDVLATFAEALVSTGQTEAGLRTVGRLETLGYAMPELATLRRMADRQVADMDER